jgi:hypothetical protein
MKVKVKHHLSVVLALVLTAGTLLASLAWSPVEAKASGTGTADDPIIIKTVDEFNDIRNNLSLHYKLGNDIDLNYSYFNPFGIDNNEVFSGSLDGAGFAVLNLYVSNTFDDDVGLFRRLSGLIKNVQVVNASVRGRENVGILFGSATGRVENSTVEGQVRGERNVGGLGGTGNYVQIKNSYADVDVTANDNVGGLIGYTYVSTLTDNSASGTTTASGNNAGGLVGHLASSILRNSSATGNVTGLPKGDQGDGQEFGEGYGGLVGFSSSASIVEYSHATGTVSSVGNALGGLIGVNGGTVEKSFASSDVRAKGENAVAGGLVGVSTSGSIKNSYVLGSVATLLPEAFLGGLAGHNGGTIINSYSVADLEGQDSTIGGLVGANTGIVTSGYYNSARAGVSDTGKGEPKYMFELLKAATFEGWDFNSVWSIVEDMDLPRLRYTITYDGNGSSSGTVPTDSTLYPDGSRTTVMTNSGGLVHERGVFAGWSFIQNGYKSHYLPGSELFTSPNNMTLYANWEPYTYLIDKLDTQNLAALTEDYAPGSQETKTVTITRAGTGNLTNLAVQLSGPGAENFEINGPVATTLNDAVPSTTFTVKVKDHVPVGQNSAKIVITADYMEDVFFYVNQSVNPSDPKPVKGDANGDGIISPADALLITKHMTGKIELTPEQIEALDMNGDGKLDGDDVKMIMEIYLGRNKE